MDKSPPRNGLIAIIGVLSVATLIAIKPGFDAYYDGMHREAMADRLETYSDLNQLEAARADWDRRLHSGSTPIDQAMTQLAERGRTAFPAIRPQPPAELNLDPLTGWAQLPQELPQAVRDAQAAAEAPAPEPALLEGELPTDGNDMDEASDAAAPEAAPAPAAAPAAPRPRPARPAPAPEEAE